MANNQNLPTNYNKQQLYTVAEASELLPQLSTSKFTGSVDLDIILDVPAKQKQLVVAGSITLPHRVSADTTIAVIAEGEDQGVAKKAGADMVGLDDLIKQIENGDVEFDVLIATPTVMRKLAKLGRVLGPKGLMPSPKNDTVTTDLEKVIKSFKAGKQNFKSTEQHAIRAKVAKLDMKPAEIAENITAFVKTVLEEADKSLEIPFKKITVSPTMGKPVKLDPSQFTE